jgi:hypothetical protein
VPERADAERQRALSAMLLSTMTVVRWIWKHALPVGLCALACSGQTTTRASRSDDKNPRSSGGQTNAGGSAGEISGGTSPSGGSSPGSGGSGTDPCLADLCLCNPCGSSCFIRNLCICDPCAEGCSGSYCPGHGGAAGESGAAGEPGSAGEGGADGANCTSVSPPGTEAICGSLAVWACPGRALTSGNPSRCTSCSAPMPICSYTLHTFEGDTCSDCCCL